jgi:hypothetical protein
MKCAFTNAIFHHWLRFQLQADAIVLLHSGFIRQHNKQGTYSWNTSNLCILCCPFYKILPSGIPHYAKSFCFQDHLHEHRTAPTVSALTPHHFLVPRSKKQSRAIPVFSLRAFVACKKGVTYLPYFIEAI